MNAAFLLISTAWLAGADVAPAPAPAPGCGCNSCCDSCCTCRPRLISWSTGCECRCRQYRCFTIRIPVLFPRCNCCCQSSCGCDSGCNGGYNGGDHGTIVPGAPATTAPEKIGPPKEMPKGGEKPAKVGAVTPDMEVAPNAAIGTVETVTNPF